MAGETIEFVRYRGLGSLPHFDDSPEIPAPVQALRDAVRAADGILICTPEYAFGVPGSLKNALDWTVSSGEFVNKPVGLITASTGGEKAHASLLLTLGAISAKVTEEATLLISFVRAKVSKDGRVSDVETADRIGHVVQALLKTIKEP